MNINYTTKEIQEIITYDCTCWSKRLGDNGMMNDLEMITDTIHWMMDDYGEEYHDYITEKMISCLKDMEGQKYQ